MRKFESFPLVAALSVWLIAGVVFHLYTAAFGVLEAWLQRLIHLTWVLPLAFLYWPFSRNSPKKTIPWYDWVLALLAILPGIYGIIHAEEVIFRVFSIDGFFCRLHGVWRILPRYDER